MADDKTYQSNVLTEACCPLSAAEQQILLGWTAQVDHPQEATPCINALIAWEQIPRFSAEHLNNKHGLVQNDHSVDFQINGRMARITLFPGTFYPTRTGNPLRRYPGVKEQLVEQALIHHAALQVQGPIMKGDASRHFTFTINALGRQLKAMGNTMSYVQIRQALDVLSSSVLTLSYGDDLKLANRDTFLSSFGRNSLSTADGNNGDDIWRIKLHPLAAQSVLNVMYHQYPVGQWRHYSPVGAALLRRIHRVANDVSEHQRYTFTVKEMKLIIAGLNHVRLAGSMLAIKKELERMQTDQYLTRFTVENVFPTVRGRGRPVPIDYRFTLYPDSQWIKSMKVGSMRQNIIG